MKKILLLLVSGLLIACMAGSALAQNGELITSHGVLLSNPLLLEPGDTAKFGVYIFNVAPTQLGDYQYHAYVTEMIGSPGNITYTPLPLTSANINVALLKTSAHVVPPYIDDVDVVSVSIPQNAGSGVYKVTLTVGNQSFDELIAASTTVETLPEFPTLALPVAGMLGFLFIFGRKKGDL